ncbi:PucR family transcriptional regulator ligand-binding domain-containing protein [Streptomyces sp. NPDC050564]|uniref:PucR family transcriptional regulator ligand-binding domain-containing protein n=1 Tax=Streptomyces sp. NPDC050564 TaxID=3365631 RepID=UPI0037B74252
MTPLSCGRNTRTTCGKYSPATRTRTDCQRLTEVLVPALTLHDILALDPVRRTEPELLAGEAASDRPVRWVHSSEVYEGANFLDSGERLLTKGFGLIDADEETRRRYRARSGGDDGRGSAHGGPTVSGSGPARTAGPARGRTPSAPSASRRPGRRGGP